MNRLLQPTLLLSIALSCSAHCDANETRGSLQNFTSNAVNYFELKNTSYLNVTLTTMNSFINVLNSLAHQCNIMYAVVPWMTNGTFNVTSSSLINFNYCFTSVYSFAKDCILISNWLQSNSTYNLVDAYEYFQLYLDLQPVHDNCVNNLDSDFPNEDEF
jgi:hypothetical protein